MPHWMRIRHVFISACLYHSSDRGVGVIHSRNGYVVEFGFDLRKKEHSNSFSLTVPPE